MHTNAKVTAGVVAGMMAALAIPVFAQTGTTSSAENTAPPQDVRPPFEERGPLTQEQLQEMITREQTALEHIDEIVAIHKDAMQDHIAALTAAASITDDAERQEAVKAAHQAMREQIKAAIEANPDLQQAGFMHFLGHGKRGRHGHGPMMMKNMGGQASPVQ